MKKHLFFFLLLLSGIAGVVSGEEINAVLATVNGQPVFLGDVLPITRNDEYQAHAALSGEELDKRIRELRTAAVNEIIDQRLLQAEYDQETFKLPQEMIEQRRDAYAEQLGCRSRQEFAAMLRREKSSVEEVRRFITARITAEIMLYRQIQPRVHVSPAEVYQFYSSNPQRFCSAENITLAMILLSRELSEEKTAAAIQEITGTLKEDPGAFARLAASFSSGPNAAEGGILGSIRRELLRKEFAEVIVTPEKGQISGPIQTEDGVAFLKIMDYQQENKIDFKTAAPEIRKELEEQQRKDAIEKYLQELRSQAVIRIFF